MPSRFISLTFIACMLFTVHDAVAQDCPQRTNSRAVVTGTLVAPAPCKPEKRATLPASPEPKREPGVIRHGNTTIYYGGSLQSETSVHRR